LRPIISTGCSGLDRLLGGGLKPGNLTLIYGEASTGKTSLAIQLAVNSARMGYKVILIDSDGSFTPQRLFQIAGEDSEEVSALIILMRPTTFEEQAEIINNLDRYIIGRLGLIIIDTITSLYRASIIGSEDTFTLNRELNRQVATLSEIAKAKSMPILLISQVRSIPREEGDMKVEPVATRVLKFWSDVIISLKREPMMGVIRATLEKPKVPDREASCLIKIGRFGIGDYTH